MLYSWSGGLPRVAPVALAFAVLACRESSTAPPEPCPRDSPAFRLQITSPEDQLPEDLRLTVGFGGAIKESYSLSGKHAGNEAVCCQHGVAVSGPLPSVSCVYGSKMAALTRDSGSSSVAPGEAVPDSGRVLADASSPVKRADSGAASTPQKDGIPAVQCVLWTDGAALIEIVAAGYQRVQETLAAEQDPEKADNCPALKTRDIELALMRGDAGAP